MGKEVIARGKSERREIALTSVGGKQLTERSKGGILKFLPADCPLENRWGSQIRVFLKKSSLLTETHPQTNYGLIVKSIQECRC